MADVDKEQKRGLLYGSLLAAGVAAASGRNLSDAIYKAALGGSSAYTGGLNQIYEKKRQELEEERTKELINASRMRNLIDLGQYQMQKEVFPTKKAFGETQLEEATFGLAEKKQQADALQQVFEILQGGEADRETLTNIAIATKDPDLLYKAANMPDMVEVDIGGTKAKVPAEKLVKSKNTINEWEVRQAAAEGNPIAIEIIAQKLKDEIKVAKGKQKPDKPTDFDKKINMAIKELQIAGNKNPTPAQIAAKLREMFPPAQGMGWMNPFEMSQTGGTPGTAPAAGKEPYYDVVTKTIKYR